MSCFVLLRHVTEHFDVILKLIPPTLNGSGTEFDDAFTVANYPALLIMGSSHGTDKVNAPVGILKISLIMSSLTCLLLSMNVTVIVCIS